MFIILFETPWLGAKVIGPFQTIREAETWARQTTSNLPDYDIYRVCAP